MVDMIQNTINEILKFANGLGDPFGNKNKQTVIQYPRNAQSQMQTSGVQFNSDKGANVGLSTYRYNGQVNYDTGLRFSDAGTSRQRVNPVYTNPSQTVVNGIVFNAD